MKDRMIPFLIKAKKATYAGKGAEAPSSRIKSHDLIYREDEFLYYDTYLGGEKFAGEETLWTAEKPYWSMNYIGPCDRRKFQRRLPQRSIAECSC